MVEPGSLPIARWRYRPIWWKVDSKVSSVEGKLSRNRAKRPMTWEEATYFDLAGETVNLVGPDGLAACQSPNLSSAGQIAASGAGERLFFRRFQLQILGRLHAESQPQCICDAIIAQRGPTTGSACCLASL